jgi:hypothetical protein
MKAICKVYENPISNKVIATFTDTDDLEEYARINHTPADQVEVNGYMLLGWDELWDFV